MTYGYVICVVLIVLDEDSFGYSFAVAIYLLRYCVQFSANG